MLDSYFVCIDPAFLCQGVCTSGAIITIKESKRFQDLGFYLSKYGLIQNFMDEAN